MADSCSYSCDSEPAEWRVNGDIAGIGVILSFHLTAWMMVILLLFYYMVTYQPLLDPFRPPDDKLRQCKHPNPIDYTILDILRRIPKTLKIPSWSILKSEQLEAALNKCVKSFADTQILTGIAIIICGFREMKCGLQAYHFQIIVHLGWIASMTHLCALSFLRSHLSSHPYQRAWRLGAMFIMLVPLAVGLWLTGHFDWRDNMDHKGRFTPSQEGLRTAAICYFDYPFNTSTKSFHAMVMLLVLLLYGYSIRVAKQSAKFEYNLREFTFRLRSYTIKKEIGDGGEMAGWDPYSAKTFLGCLRVWILDPYLIALFRVLHIHIDLVTSFLSEVYWLTMCTFWGSTSLFSFRNLGPREENTWAFGQILPLLLLAAPIPAVAGHFSPPAESEQSDPTPGLALNGPLGASDHEYEATPSFRGALALAGLSYIEAGICFVVHQNESLFASIEALAFAFLVYAPILQMIWVVSVLWISKVAFWTKWKYNFTLMLIFFTLLCLTFSELMVSSINVRTWNLPETYWSKVPVLEAARSMGMLVSSNLVLVLWFIWGRRQQEATSRWKAFLHVLLRLVVWAALMGISYVVYFAPHDAESVSDLYPDTNGFDIVSFSAAPTAWLLIWLFVEWAMDKWSLKRETCYSIRTTAIFLMVVFFFVSTGLETYMLTILPGYFLLGFQLSAICICWF